MPRNSFWKSVFGERQRTVRDAGRGEPKGGGATVSKNKNPHPAGDTAEQGKGGKSGETSSSFNFTSGGAGRQGRIFPLLLEGEAAALPASDLAKLAGFKNERTMRAQIDRERANGAMILASEFGYYRPSPGARGIMEMRRFIRRQDARAASNRRTIRLIRARLRELEKRPLEGQETIWNEEGDS